ncbi:hypothetical protein C6P41_002612, partial [Kluyveromyces marxianus]
NEFAVVNPPEGQTCGQYFTTFIKDNTGYLKNPDDTESCHYCPYSYQQEVVEQYNVRWTYRWRNFGFLWAYIGFNFFAMLACYWVLRVKNYSLTSIFGVFKIGHWKNVTSKPKPRHEKDHTIFEEKAGDAANVKKNEA